MTDQKMISKNVPGASKNKRIMGWMSSWRKEYFQEKDEIAKT
jgi:hypothetical protein